MPQTIREAIYSAIIEAMHLDLGDCFATEDNEYGDCADGDCYCALIVDGHAKSVEGDG